MEIKSQKWKVIRVESEETQDCAREEKSTEFEKEEERTFIPRAVSVPFKPLFRCDNRCSECRQIHLTRHFSHAVCLFSDISHCMAQDEPPNVSAARTHSIFMPSMMSV